MTGKSDFEMMVESGVFSSPALASIFSLGFVDVGDYRAGWLNLSN